MISKALGITVLFFALLSLPAAWGDGPAPNPRIDMPAHLEASREAAEHRATRRVSETDFLRMIADPNTVLLDARSRLRFQELHIEGAVNLPFPDFSTGSLAKVLPTKETRVLIYCNNNFQNAEDAFFSKTAPAALNISTYETLYIYGYRNIYELAPLIDIRNTILPLEGSLAPRYR